MKDYALNVLWSDEDESYIATVPDLRGCSAFGSTPEEAVREVQVAKRLWIESARASGDPVPDPSYHPGEGPRTAAG